MPKIEAFLTRKANKEAIEATPVVDGQLLWDKETGETYADVGNRRISTGKKQVYTATITSENGRLVCDMTASQIIDADRQGIVKAVYTDDARGETRVYLYAKKLKDGRAVFSKDGYIEDGAVKQALIIVDFAGNVTVEEKTAEGLPPIGPDDEGKVLTAEGGKYALMGQGYVTPEMFGAKGDGVTDDTVAIDKAIARGEVLDAPVLGFGTYLISTSVYIKANTYLRNIVYTGTYYAAVLSNKSNIKFEWDNLTAESGGGVLVEYTEAQDEAPHNITLVANADTWTLENCVSYTANVPGKGMQDMSFILNGQLYHKKGNGISVYVTGEGAWVGEIRLFGGWIIGDRGYALSLYAENGAYMTAFRSFGTGYETNEGGFYFENAGQIFLCGSRYEGSRKFKFVGVCQDVYISGDCVEWNGIDVTELTPLYGNNMNIRFDCPVAVDGTIRTNGAYLEYEKLCPVFGERPVSIQWNDSAEQGGCSPENHLKLMDIFLDHNVFTRTWGFETSGTYYVDLPEFYGVRAVNEFNFFAHNKDAVIYLYDTTVSDGVESHKQIAKIANTIGVCNVAFMDWGGVSIRRDNYLSAVDNVELAKMENTPETTVNVGIIPGKFYKWGVVTGTLSPRLQQKSANGLNKYQFQFSTGSSKVALYVYQVRWEGGFVSSYPTEPNKTYQVTIIDGIGTVVAVDNETTT